MDSVWPARCACIGAVVLALLASIAVDLHVNPVGRTRRYQLARLRNWMALGLVYMLFYEARYAATISNTHEMRARMGVSAAEYGSILTAGFWAYAFSIALNGHRLDAIGGRAALLIGSVGCALSCFCMGCLVREHQPPFVPLLILNVANLGFNCLAALAILRINVNWYGKLERGVFSGVSCSGSNGTRLELVDQSQSLVLQIFGAMASLGYWLALTVGSWAEADLPRGSAFFLPTALLLTVAAPLCFFVVQDSPVQEEVPLGGLPSSEVSNTQPPQFREALVAVLSDARVRAVILAFVGVGWAREGFLSWFGSYLEATSGVVQGGTHYTVMSTAMSLASIATSLFGGFASDRFFGSKRGPVLVGYLACSMICLFALHLAEGHAIASVIIVPFVSSVVFACATLLMGAAASDFVTTELAGTASGLLNLGQYTGCGLAAQFVGLVIDATGSWRFFPAIVALGSLLASVGTARLLWLQHRAKATPASAPPRLC